MSNQYTPHESAFQVLTVSRLLMAIRQNETAVARGYHHVTDVHGVEHKIQVLCNDNLENADLCKTIVVSFRVEAMIITNTYEEVYCTALQMSLPLWQLIHQVRHVAGFPVKTWDIEMDIQFYEKERRQFFRNSGKAQQQDDGATSMPDEPVTRTPRARYRST